MFTVDVKQQYSNNNLYFLEIITELAQYLYGYKISIKFDNGPHRVINIRVIAPYLVKNLAVKEIS